MDVGSLLGKAAGTVAGGSALPLTIMLSFFSTKEDATRLEARVDSHVSDYNITAANIRIGTVQGLIRDLMDEPAGAYHDSLCRQLEQQLAEICRETPDDSFCLDRLAIMEKGGCA